MLDILTRTGIQDRETYSERSRRVTGSSPAGTTVQSHTLIGNDLEESTATESFGVRLSLDLQDIQGKQDDLSDTDQTVACQQLDLSLHCRQRNLTFQQWRA